MTTILPRSAWTSTPNARRTPLSVTSVVWFVPHWPATAGVIGVESRAATAARLRGWRDHHMRGNGWRDIGYNYAVDQAGRIWNLTGDHVAAHAGPQVNPRGLGVLCVLGMSEQPSTAMVNALRSLYALKRRKFHRMDDVAGHGQTPGNSTECPGGPMRRVISSGAIKTPTQGGPDMSASQYANAVWGKVFNAYNSKEDYGFPKENAGRRLRRATDRAGRAMVLGRRNAAEIAGLKAAVRALGQAQGIDPATVEKAVTDATTAALADLEVTLKVDSDDDGTEA